MTGARPSRSFQLPCCHVCDACGPSSGKADDPLACKWSRSARAIAPRRFAAQLDIATVVRGTILPPLRQVPQIARDILFLDLYAARNSPSS